MLNYQSRFPKARASFNWKARSLHPQTFKLPKYIFFEIYDPSSLINKLETKISNQHWKPQTRYQLTVTQPPNTSSSPLFPNQSRQTTETNSQRRYSNQRLSVPPKSVSELSWKGESAMSLTLGHSLMWASKKTDWFMSVTWKGKHYVWEIKLGFRCKRRILRVLA